MCRCDGFGIEDLIALKHPGLLRGPIREGHPIELGAVDDAGDGEHRDRDRDIQHSGLEITLNAKQKGKKAMSIHAKERKKPKLMKEDAQRKHKYDRWI